MEKDNGKVVLFILIVVVLILICVINWYIGEDEIYDYPKEQNKKIVNGIGN